MLRPFRRVRWTGAYGALSRDFFTSKEAWAFALSVMDPEVLKLRAAGVLDKNDRDVRVFKVTPKNGRAPAPGRKWRVLAHDLHGNRVLDIESEDNRRREPHRLAKSSRRTERTSVGESEFDELVIDSWFHLEQMSRRVWSLILGDVYLSLFVRSDGLVRVTVTEGKERLRG